MELGDKIFERVLVERYCFWDDLRGKISISTVLFIGSQCFSDLTTRCL